MGCVILLVSKRVKGFLAISSVSSSRTFSSYFWCRAPWLYCGASIDLDGEFVVIEKANKV